MYTGTGDCFKFVEDGKLHVSITSLTPVIDCSSFDVTLYQFTWPWCITIRKFKQNHAFKYNDHTNWKKVELIVFILQSDIDKKLQV